MPCGVKGLKDGAVQLMGGGHAVAGDSHVHPDGEVQGAVAVDREIDLGRRHCHHPGVGLANLGEQLRHLAHVRTVGDPHLQGKAVNARPIMGPVGDLVGYQFRVGDNQDGPVEGLEDGAPHPDLLHRPPLAVDHQHVPHLDGSFKQEDEAAEKIIDDVLEAEADPHSQGPGHQGQVAQLKSQDVQGD